MYQSITSFTTEANAAQGADARLGNQNIFSVAWDQMLVAWGDQVPLAHSLEQRSNLRAITLFTSLLSVTLIEGDSQLPIPDIYHSLAGVP